MATKTLYFYLNPSEDGFISKFFKSKEQFDPADIAQLRKILSKERGRVLYFLKKEKISSIYQLSKLLKRDFKSVYSDLKMLEKFGIIEFFSEKKGKKDRLVPRILYDRIEFILSF
ncbi:MAG: hypothetical protein QXX68_00125 [Candidatus Pacearchaeota archaeon]